MMSFAEKTSRPTLIGPGRLVLVVGPSGAGKDTLIAGAKAACAGDRGIVFARRVITRPASEFEDHDTLTDAAFGEAVKAGELAFWWSAHGLKYGIPCVADHHIRAGLLVVCNVSRGLLAELRGRYAHVHVVLVTAPAEILAMRLAGRSRKTDGSLLERAKRNAEFGSLQIDNEIENSGAPEIAVRQLFAVIHNLTASSAA